MWLSIAILVALVVLAVLGYLYTAQKDKPIADDMRYMMVYEDGLLDLSAGLFLLSAGIMLDANSGLIGIFIPLLYVLLLLAKRASTEPRLDPAALPADVTKRRQLKMFMLLGVTLLVGMVAFLLFVVDIAAVRGWLDQYLTPTIVIAITALLTIWAYRTGVWRLSLYAAFVLAIYLSSFWLPVTLPIYLIALGIGVMLVGIGVTVRFVQEHPKLSMSGS
jgi:hypothetical protein